MGQSERHVSEASRLEALWSGEFGDAYVGRNANVAEYRGPFWKRIVEEHAVRSALEVGCNIGGNLHWLAQLLPPGSVFGVDVNAAALRHLHRQLADVNAILAPARDLPFRDKWFDMTFTCGVLIHQPESTLPIVMSEIVRCSKRLVLCAEYASERTVEVPYRGQEGALFKRNYGQIYRELFPELKLRQTGFLGKDTGWDDVTYWVFEKVG